MRVLSLAAIWLTVVASSASPASQGGHLFHFTESPGPYAVGLKVVEQYDESRTYLAATDALGRPNRAERARPLQTLIWYPAEPTHGRPMTVADYGALLATETSFGKPQLSSDWKRWLEAMTPTLKDKLWAVRDAPLKAGRFPVVIYAPSFSSMSWENADLCEYLASHGYVVLATPNLGAATRAMTVDVTGIDAQARDISFLVGYAGSLPDTDVSEIAVAGFSWGGISNLFAAARDNRIDALIAFDGSMRYFPGLVRQAGDVRPQGMTIPLLFFTQGELTLEDQERELNDPGKTQAPNVLNAWTHGDLLTIHMLGLVHTEFSSMYQRNEDMWNEFPHEQKADYSRDDGITGYAWFARYALHFVDAYLKHDAASLAYLKKTPAENGVPPHFMSVAVRTASGTPSSLDGLRSELGKRGFGHAGEVYASLQKQDSTFKLDETRINSWATDLLDERHVPEALELFKLNATLYPDSGDVYSSLAQAYEASGQAQLAIENYQKCLEKDPDNFDALRKVKELGAGQAVER
jgi:dienelactone hydrolase